MITPTAIAQYKRAMKNDGKPHSEVFTLTRGNAMEFLSVYPTGGKRRVSYAGRVYITFGGYVGVNASKLTKCVNRFGTNARVLGAWKFDNSGHKLGHETLSSLAGSAIFHGHTCYYGDTKSQPHGNSAVLVEVSADANTLTLYLFEGKAGLMASLYDAWCAGRLILQAA